ncbi:MAG TPA: glycosyltransferase family 1 protein [Acidimicrobiales bacterium]|nr:glycosyltransferase family 1 protein [Acidimicrobiales bacterium]
MKASASSAPIRLVIDGKPLVAPHFSGVGNYTLHLLQALDARIGERGDIDARLAVPFGTASIARGYGFERIRPLRIPATFTQFQRLQQAGRVPPMDLILGRGVYFFPDFSRWPLARSRCITAVHDLCFETVPDMVDEANGAYLRGAVRGSVTTSDLVTALTHGMRQEIIDFYGIADDRVRVVSCAADEQRFYRRSAAEIADMKHRLGIFGDYLVAVGNIEPRKNQARLIRAFTRLDRAVSDRFTLVIAGAGAWRDAETRAAAEQAIAAGHKVKLLIGEVLARDLPALYSGATASVYVSWYEGFGMPPIESMAAGTPVVAGNRSVLPEVTGDAALLVDPGDEAAIASALARVCTDTGLRDELTAKGYENITRYRWSTAADALADAVHELAGRSVNP